MLVLAVFALLCGLHIAGGHHDSHSGSFGLTSDALILLGLIGFAILLAGSRPGSRTLLAAFLSLPVGAPPPAALPSRFVRSQAPLLC